MSTSKRSLNEPLAFTPFYRPQVWGGRRLAELLGKSLPAGLSIGESWELSGQQLHVSTVSDGPWQGTSLNDLWADRRRDLWNGDEAPPQFPWLIKWLDCHDRLSVQVHPNDALAQRLLGEPFGKTESWVVLHAEPGAEIFAGLKSGVTREELIAHSRAGTIADCLHRLTPRAGDCLHIPAGTVHAIGGGVVVAEIQQTSDATFRLFDWNRVDSRGNSRALHIDQALEAIDFNRGPIVPQIPETASDQAAAPCELLIQSPYYQLQRVTLAEPWTADIQGMEVWMSLRGQARVTVAGSNRSRTFRTGETLLVPASAKTARWEPRAGQSAVLLRVKQPQPNPSLKL